MSIADLISTGFSVISDAPRNFLCFGLEDSYLPYLLREIQSISPIINHCLGWMHPQIAQLLHEIFHNIALMISTTKKIEHLCHMLSTLIWIFRNYHLTVMPDNYFESMRVEMKLEAWGMAKARLQKKRPKWWIRSRIRFYVARNYLMNWIRTIWETTTYVSSVVACSVLQRR